MALNVELEPGKYVVAVSGGVDSMVLLHVLTTLPDLRLIIAHYDHGIREDSSADSLLVERVAERLGLPFVGEQGRLGVSASEATARRARYAFLRRARESYGAKAIVTAHHQDDLLETAIINILRGTGRKGLSSLQSTNDILRPFLQVTKKQIFEYASLHPEIVWHEDETNQDNRYLRNYIRNHLIKRMGEEGRGLLLQYVERAAETNPLIDMLLLHEMRPHHTNSDALNRQWLTMLPYDVSCEVVAAWLRAQGVREFDRKMINRLVVFAKTAQKGKKTDIDAAYLLEVSKHDVKIKPR